MATKGIPAPVGVKDPTVERILWAMRDQLQSGATDDPRFREIAARLNNIEGGGSTGEPIRPLAPIELEATGIFGAIILEIPYLPPGAAYVEWLASDTDDLGAAQVVGTSLIPLFRHYVGDGIGRYYWVRGVGRGDAALRGPVNQTAGTYAESAQDPEYLKDVLEGQITETELFADLAARIDGAGRGYDAFFTQGVAQWSESLQGETVPPVDNPDISGELADGTRVVRLTGDERLYASTPIPVDTSRRYKGRFRVRQTVDHSESRVYAGVRCLDADYNAVPGNNCYFVAVNVDISVADGWRTFEGVITGEGGSGTEAFRPGTKYVRPMFIVNYQNGNGTAEVDYLQFFDADEGIANQGALIEQSQSIDGLEGQYTVKIDSNGHVAGYGLSVEPAVDGTPSSNFIVRADRFAVVNPSSSGNGIIPFIVSGGNVVFDTGFIGNATITSAQIESLGANKIVADSLSAISANLGTVSAGTFQTSAGTGNRVEISSAGAFPIWAGSGSKTAGNADLYLDGAGLHAKGDITARRLEANSANIISTLMLQGNAVTIPIGRYFTSRATIEEDGWQNAAALNVPANSFPSGTQVAITFGGHYFIRTTGSIANTQARLRIDGNVIETFSAKSAYITITAGSFDYQIAWNSVSYTFITALSSGSHQLLFDFDLSTNDTQAPDRDVEDCFISVVGYKDSQ